MNCCAREKNKQTWRLLSNKTKLELTNNKSIISNNKSHNNILFVRIITTTVLNTRIIRKEPKMESVNVDVYQETIFLAIQVQWSLVKENLEVVRIHNLFNKPIKMIKKVRRMETNRFIKKILMILLTILCSRRVQHNRMWKNLKRKNQKKRRMELVENVKK